MHTITYARAIKEAMAEEMSAIPRLFYTARTLLTLVGSSRLPRDSRKSSVRTGSLTHRSQKMRSLVQESVPR